jgi:hypothetical protein
MSIQTFTASQVLTAAQMNTLQANDYNQTVSTKTASYVLVAADKGTRVVMNVASANTVTVNTSLFSAGDTLVIQNIGAGVTTVTAGTATVSSAGPLAIPQNGSGTLYFTSAGVSIFYPTAGPAASSGLTFISSTNLSGSSTTISGCFSATYECYFVTMSNMLVGSGSVSLQMRLGSGTNHTYNNQVINAPGDAIGTGYSGTNQNTIQIANVSTTNMQNSVFWINSPYLSINTQVFGETSHSTIFTCTQANEQSATSFTSLTYSISASTFSSGVVKVYGYSLS